MREWVHMFVRRPFDGMGRTGAEDLISHAVEKLRPEMFHDGIWWADYVRLRMCAKRVA